MSIPVFDQFPRALGPDDPVIIGEWKILHVIGQGGMGKVFEGVRGDHTKSAIKIILAETITDSYLMRFKKEINAMKLINSPYVAKIYNSDDQSDLPYMAIEYIHGKSLAKLIENNLQISEKIWFNFALQLFSGLKAIHSRGLIHRDITPKNVMKLEDREILKIIDFGLVRGDDSRLSNKSVLIGTLPYMSPEQLQYMAPSQKSDVFSAGVTLVHLFTKKHPFQPKDSKDVISYKIINDSPNLEGLTKLQKDICLKLLDKNPANRPTADEVTKFIINSGILLLKPKAKPVPRAKPAAKKIVAKPAPKSSNLQKLHTNKLNDIDPVLVGVIDEYTDFIKPSAVESSYPQKAVVIQVPEKLKNEIKTLGEIVKIVIQNIPSNKQFHLDFFSKKLNQDIYFQGFIDNFDDNNEMLIEGISNNYLTNQLSDDKVKLMMDLGWKYPETDFPNYFRKDLKSEDFVNFISSAVAKSVYMVYEANLETEFSISPLTPEVKREIKSKTNIVISDDGSFVLRNQTLQKNNPYIKWQVIGFFIKSPPNAYLLTDIFVRHRETNRVFFRKNGGWIFHSDDPNPIISNKDQKPKKFAFILSTPAIIKFDKAEKKDWKLTFNAVSEYLDMVPELSERYLEEEKANPLTDEMIIEPSKDPNKIDKEFGIDPEYSSAMPLFTLFSSDPQIDGEDPGNAMSLGLFAKHPITNKFYGRKNGKWKLLFENPQIYGYPSYLLEKSVIKFFDSRDKNLSKPITYEEFLPHFYW